MIGLVLLGVKITPYTLIARFGLNFNILFWSDHKKFVEGIVTAVGEDSALHDPYT